MTKSERVRIKSENHIVLCTGVQLKGSICAEQLELIPGHSTQKTKVELRTTRAKK